MPNPLSRVLSGRPSFYLTHDALFDPIDDPEGIDHIAGVIATWSYCELELAEILSCCLKTNLRIAYAMLNALRNSEARRAAIEAAAKVSLSRRDFRLYEKVDKATRSSRQTRNKFAHGLWGSLPKLKKSLLLVDIEDMADTTVAWSTYTLRKNGSKDPYPSLDYSKVMVYKTSELLKCREEAEHALSLLRGLRFVLSASPKTRAARRSELLTALEAQPSPLRQFQRRTGLALR